ncbi:hypothetical protein FGG08_007352 [Glutinoglossum americanum]|uniref:Uncharacterized protein n=1 Tax=Glutinoglossum americanum TaxID=1670608 RepID=A0A9P8L054_9PEZI|nr:hypothetical protein FGG08_007352 [Glutinoglossum americanum]
MSDSTANILKGRLWVNYGPNVPFGLGPRITVAEYTSYRLLAGIAVWITVWSAGYRPLFVWLLSRVIEHCIVPIIAYFQAGGSGRGVYYVADTEHLLGQIRDNEIYQDISHLASDSHTAEDCTLRVLCGICSSVTRPERRCLSIWHILAMIVSFGIFIALAIGATKSADLALDSSVVSTSQKCGIWAPDPTHMDTVDPADTPMGGIIGETVPIYDSCYGAQQGCPYFTESELYDKVTVNALCPFTNNSMCLQGASSALEFDTGFIDGSKYGINVEPGRAPWVRLRTACAPVVVEGYYTSETDTTTNYTIIKFHYGPRSNDPTTFKQTRSLHFEDTFSPTGYELKAVSERLRQFLPIAGLNSTNPLSHTILAFLTIFNIEYPYPITDPIFSALTNCTSDLNKQCFKNKILHASVLGCTESALLCPPSSRDPKSEECLDVFSYTNITDLLTAIKTWGTGKAARADLGASALLAQGLFYSDLANTLATRHGFLLNATGLITGSRTSQPLSTNPPQWQLEVKRLFEIGILRAKMEMLAVVRGKRGGLAGICRCVDAARGWGWSGDGGV